MIYKKLKKDISAPGVGVVTPPLQDYAKKNADNIFTANNSFNLPIVVAPAQQDNQAVTKQQLDDATANIAPPNLAQYARKDQTNVFEQEQHFGDPAAPNNRIILKGSALTASKRQQGGNWLNYQVISTNGAQVRLKGDYLATDNDDLTNKEWVEAQLVPFQGLNGQIQTLGNRLQQAEQTIQQLEASLNQATTLINQLQQELNAEKTKTQALEQWRAAAEPDITQLNTDRDYLMRYKDTIDPLILEFRDQFKPAVNELKVWRQTAEPLVSDYERNGAKTNRHNVFTQPNDFNNRVVIEHYDDALAIIQDNRAAYIAIKTNAGVVRGYVGVGITGTNDMTVAAPQGDVHLKPRSNVNVNNARILNLTAGRNATDAANKGQI